MYLPEFNIAIEADGPQHYTKEGMFDDLIREQQIKKVQKYQNIKFLRFSNADILEDKAFRKNLVVGILTLAGWNEYAQIKFFEKFPWI